MRVEAALNHCYRHKSFVYAGTRLERIAGKELAQSFGTTWDNVFRSVKAVVAYGMKSVRAYLLKESFQLFWDYTSPYWAEWYLKKWCARAMRSRLDPIKAFVRSLCKHQPLIMNWFKAKKAYSCGVVEGLNRKINLVTRKSFGFRSFDVLTIALFHTMGDLPEPGFAHKFC